MSRLDAHILLITDDDDLIALFGVVSTRTDIRCRVVSTLSDAYGSLAAEHYDVCVIDIDRDDDWSAFTEAVGRREHPPEMLLVLPRGTLSDTLSMLNTEGDCIPKSRLDPWLLERTISWMMERRRSFDLVELNAPPERSGTARPAWQMNARFPDGSGHDPRSRRDDDRQPGTGGSGTGGSGRGGSGRGQSGHGQSGREGHDDSGTRTGGRRLHLDDLHSPEETGRRGGSAYPLSPDRADERGGGTTRTPATAAQSRAWGSMADQMVDSILATAICMIVVLDAEGRIVRFNRMMETLTGYTADEVVGTYPWFLVAPEQRKWTQERFREILEARTSGWKEEIRLVTRSGEERLVDWATTVVRDENGNPAYLIGAGNDITEQRATERSLRESEERFRVIIEHGGDDVTIIDAQGLVQYETPSVGKITGYAPEELTGRSTFERIHPDDRAWVQAMFLEVIGEPRGSRRATYRYIHKDGRVIHLESIGTNMLDDPTIRGVIINTRDVTDRVLYDQERVAAMNALRESEERYRVVAEERQRLLTLVKIERDRLDTTVRTIPGMIWEARRVGDGFSQEMIFVNDYVETIFGYAPEEWKRTPDFWLKLIHPDDLPRMLARAEDFSTQNEIHELYRAIRKDGEVIWVDVRLAILRDEAGEPIGTIGFAFDVTDRKRMEEERENLLALVNAERDRLDTIMRTVPGMIWEARFDAAGTRTVFVNDYVETIYGYSVEEWKQSPNFWRGTVHPEDRERIAANMRSMATHNEIHDSYRAFRKDGRMIWIDVRLVVLRDETGQPAGLLGFTLDVTDRKMAEQALLQSERRYRSLVTATAQMVWTTDTEGRTKSQGNGWGVPVVPGYELLPPATDADAWRAAIHPEDLPGVLEKWLQALETTQWFESEYRLMATDGAYRTLHVRGIPVLDDEGTVLEWVGTCTDVTVQRRNLQALHESEARLRVAIMSSPITVFNQGLDLRYTWIYSAAISDGAPKLVGRHDREIFDVPEEAEEIVELKQRVLDLGQGIRSEVKITIDGDVRYFDHGIEPLKDGHGTVVGLTGAAIDITERKRAELALQEAHDRLETRVQERTEEIRMMMQRLEEAYANQKRFVADASHDLRTPLTAIRAELDLLLQRDGLEDQLRQTLQRITGQARRLDQLTNDLLVLATLDTNQTLSLVGQIRIDDLVIEGICHLSTLAAEKNVAWNIQFDTEIELTCEPTSMRRALFNVLENATKYSLPDTVIDVFLRQTESEVTIEVTDHGMGIREEDLPRIFERFYRGDRTRTTQGTGLGLAIVKAVVDAHAGSIEVISEPEVGTTVRISLPRPGGEGK